MTRKLLAAAALLAAAVSAFAQPAPVKAEGAWMRPAVQGQGATGAYVVLTASEPLTLVGASSPIAEIAEIHEMKMEGDVMRMRAAPEVKLEPGRKVELKPGGLHVMLMALKMQVKAGTQVPLTLQFRNAKGQTSKLELQVPVQVQGGNNPHKH
ncbi:copper chaperone PCu(A)C [Ramlibacter albus]|uniref:Copper chaperone PCu(A)C n=1 Tax=Ramlibacter albus TaxID=2079448 RepID=A0A923M688_9BURK|nr:copper chaperone PCu(A)C [Ramlibacter albus]MBC5763541.1 copper chaperone PCu(A)C [Ramlibacter albus]